MRTAKDKPKKRSRKWENSMKLKINFPTIFIDLILSLHKKCPGHDSATNRLITVDGEKRGEFILHYKIVENCKRLCF